MSLLNTESRPCALLARASVDDNEGGQIVKYIRGAHFSAVISPDNTVSSKKILGNNEISAKTYKIFYPSRISMKLHDVVQSLDDGMVYKVKALETLPAKSASIQYSLVSAEEWELPHE